jgi:hypothetical protein
MSQENVEAVKAAYRAFQSGDVQAAVQAMAPDVEYSAPESLPWGGTQHGHNEVLAAWGRIPENLDDFSVEPLQVLDAGDHIVVIGRSRGRAKSSGVEVTTEYAQVFEFGDGKVARVRIYVDPTETVRALEGQAVA